MKTDLTPLVPLSRGRGVRGEVKNKFGGIKNIPTFALSN